MTAVTESAAYQRDDGMWVIPRDEFARDRFDYKPGNHVVFGGPSQRAGKTTLAFKLLEYTATPEFPAWVAVCKPEDKVSASEGKRLGFRRSADYPPQKRIRDIEPANRPPGYLIWPDMSRPQAMFRRPIRDVITRSTGATRISCRSIRISLQRPMPAEC